MKQGLGKPKRKNLDSVDEAIKRRANGKVALDDKTSSRFSNKNLTTNSIMISEDRDIFDLAPQYEERVAKVLTSQDGVLRKARAGDYIQFIKNIGGGGGHRLIVKDFTLEYIITGASKG